MIERILSAFNEKIPNKRVKSIILHGLFWFVWLSRNFYDSIQPFELRGALMFVAVILITQLPLVYFHLYVLVPKLLNRKKYILYILSTVACVITYSYCNYSLMRSLPAEWTPELMKNFFERVSWNYDILEGVIAIILTYSLKYTLIAFITQNELLKLQKEKLQLELNALKAQINPHFLFNTLNNLYSLTLKNSEKSSEVVLKLSDIMRYVLYQSNEEKVPLQKELEFIQNYVALQRIRYSDNYKIDFAVNGNVNGQAVAPLLMIDFIENAFKHGLDKRFNNGWVKINIDLAADEMRFTIANTKGQDEQPAKSKNGIGLTNVKRRLELMYAGNYSLNISDKNETYEVALKLNFTS